MSSKKKEVSNFDFESFKSEALSRLQKGEKMTGEDGVLNPLIKHFLESLLEGEMDVHLNQEKGLGKRSILTPTQWPSKLT